MSENYHFQRSLMPFAKADQCHLTPTAFVHPEPTFLSPRAYFFVAPKRQSRGSSSWGRHPEGSEVYLATSRQDNVEGTFMNSPPSLLDKRKI